MPVSKREMEKLPKWAQEHIRAMERERDVAVRALNEALADQVPGPISTSEYESTGENVGPTLKTRYFHAKHLTIEHHGVRLDVTLKDDSPNSSNSIYLSWSSPDRGMDHVAFIPVTFQQAELISKENMR